MAVDTNEHVVVSDFYDIIAIGNVQACGIFNERGCSLLISVNFDGAGAVVADDKSIIITASNVDSTRSNAATAIDYIITSYERIKVRISRTLIAVVLSVSSVVATIKDVVASASIENLRFSHKSYWSAGYFVIALTTVDCRDIDGRRCSDFIVSCSSRYFNL